MSRNRDDSQKKFLTSEDFEIFRQNVQEHIPVFPYDNFVVVNSWELHKYYNIGCNILYMVDRETNYYIGFIPCNTFLCPVLDVKKTR